MSNASAHPQPAAAQRSLLVLTRFTPLNGLSGTGTYLFSILSYLHRQGVTVYVCWSERPDIAGRRGWWIVPKDLAGIATLLIPGSIALGRLRIFPSVFLDPLKTGLRRAKKAVRIALSLGSLFRKKQSQTESVTPVSPTTPPVDPYAWDRPLNPYEHVFFGDAIAKLQPDALLFNYCWMSTIVQSLPDPARFQKITLTYDLRHICSTLVDGKIEWREGEFMSKELETNLLRPSDVIVAIREDDAEIFRSLLPGTEAIVAHPALEPRISSRVPAPNRCVFVAANNQANREGLHWFLNEVWPKVRATNPAAHLHICGTICKTLSDTPPGVVLLGFVDSLQAVYEEASVVIVPLLRGSGVKIKLMEAVAHGKASVSTPIGAEGVPALNSCVAIAGTADEFSAHVVRLLTDADFRRSLEERAAATVIEQFSANACYGPLCAQIQKGITP